MNYALGCDISAWQGDVDFGMMKSAGADFVIVKASQGSGTNYAKSFIDNKFVRSWTMAKQTGLLRGAYHFLTWDVDPVIQADFFCNLLMEDPGDLPPAADFEWWKTTPGNALDILRKFCERINTNIRKTPAIYTATGFWNQFGSSDEYWAQYPLWVASWGKNDPSNPPSGPIMCKPWSTWTFWQTTSKGDGIKFGAVNSKQIDLNYFNGDAESLYKYAGATAPVHTPNIEERVTALEEKVDKLITGMI
jgi:lysozyme